MKEVENVTGSMGEGEAVTPAEEVTIGVAADGAGIEDEVNADANIGAGEVAIMHTNGSAATPRNKAPDPWQALMQVGEQFITTLAAAPKPEAASHPWIERSGATGATNLKRPGRSPRS